MAVIIKTQEEILSNYEHQADQIIKHMYKVLMRAQRKSDDIFYRKTLDKLQAETQK